MILDIDLSLDSITLALASDTFIVSEYIKIILLISQQYVNIYILLSI